MTTPYRADQFEPLAPEKAAAWADFPNIDRPIFPNVVEMSVDELRLDYARARIPGKPEFEQPAGVMHGGAIATLIDTVAVPAILTYYDEFRPIFTIGMNVRYLRPIVASPAIAEGWVRQRGKSIVFLDVDVWDDQHRLCATGQLTYKV